MFILSHVKSVTFTAPWRADVNLTECLRAVLSLLLPPHNCSLGLSLTADECALVGIAVPSLGSEVSLGITLMYKSNLAILIIYSGVPTT